MTKNAKVKKLVARNESEVVVWDVSFKKKVTAPQAESLFN